MTPAEACLRLREIGVFLYDEGYLDHAEEIKELVACLQAELVARLQKEATG